jgi:multidrug resistance efflux pump
MATPNPVRKWTLVVLVICFVIFGYSLIADRLVPYTSQAVVQAYIVGIAPEVAGRIIAVNVEDNQQVKAGQILFRLDPEPYRIAVEEAEAKLAAAGQSVSASTAGVASAEHKVAEMTARRNSPSRRLACSSWSRGTYAAARADSANGEQGRRGAQQAEAELDRAARTSGPQGQNPQLREQWPPWTRPSSISAGPMCSHLPTGLSPICS